MIPLIFQVSVWVGPFPFPLGHFGPQSLGGMSMVFKEFPAGAPGKHIVGLGQCDLPNHWEPEGKVLSGLWEGTWGPTRDDLCPSNARYSRRAQDPGLP